VDYPVLSLCVLPACLLHHCTRHLITCMFCQSCATCSFSKQQQISQYVFCRFVQIFLYNRGCTNHSCHSNLKCQCYVAYEAGRLQLLEILEIYWNLESLVDILQIFWNLIAPPGNFLHNRSMLSDCQEWRPVLEFSCGPVIRNWLNQLTFYASYFCCINWITMISGISDHAMCKYYRNFVKMYPENLLKICLVDL